MRTEELWRSDVEEGLIDKLPKRIARDIRNIPYPVSKLQPVGSYYMHGPVGTGKTLWAAWMFLEACKQRWLAGQAMDVYFTKSTEFFHTIKGFYMEPTGGELAYINTLSDCYLLIMDDFGTERPSDWAISLLYLLIDRRYENDGLTIFTSNLSLEEAAKRLGDDRITARIERMCQIIHKKEL